MPLSEPPAEGTSRIPCVGETLEHSVYLLQDVMTRNERLSNIVPSLVPQILSLNNTPRMVASVIEGATCKRNGSDRMSGRNARTFSVSTTGCCDRE